YRLRRRVEERIQQHREQAHENAYLGFLDPEDGDTPLAVRPDVCFSFPNEYPYNRLYDGGHTFHNHYYPQIGDFDSGEEERCAQFIDRLPPIDYWVRNLDRRPRHAFWLQTSTDRFYPDFVCRLRDERYLVVEYKGADRWSDDDSHEKRTLGELWAERSDGQCLFVMPKGPDHDTIRAEVG
ncbi:MAG: restriction endonuclease subunit R, partial [Bacteroidetes bacterium QS_8_68_15]